MWAEPTSGCLSDDVPGQPQRNGQGETRRHAKLMDTGGIRVENVRHEESLHEREPRRLDDEADAETANRTAHVHRGLRVCGTLFEASRSTWYEIGGKFEERAKWVPRKVAVVQFVLAWKVEFGRRGREFRWQS